MALLSVQDLAVSFHTRDGVVEAVKGISYEVESGGTLGIVGESGSGKSVSCHSLLDLIPKPPGRIESGQALFAKLDLLHCSRQQMQAIRGDRIAMIFQDPMTSLNPYLSIETQLLEPLLFHAKMDKKSAIKKAIESLEEVGINDAQRKLDFYPHEFSGGMRQRVMIAMALMTEPDLLIADEPTTALDVTVQAQILSLLKTLQKKHGIGIIFITHDLAVVAQIADDIIVMKQGHIVESGLVGKVLQSPQHEYTQKLLQAIPKGSKPAQYQLQDDPEPVLELQNVKTSYRERRTSLFKKPAAITPVVDNVSLHLREGEILGLVGESGCGKSTLSKTVMRLVKEDSGFIKLLGKELTSSTPTELKTLRKDFQMIFQDPYASLNPRMSVYDTLAEPLKLYGLARSKSDMDAQVATLLSEVGLSPRDVRKYPHEFSGGQRQRIAIARAIAVRPKLLIADEPVSALDVTIQAQILNLILALNKKYALSILFISHDLGVVCYISDRIAVMQQGKIIELDDTKKIFANAEHAYTRALLAAAPQIPC